MCKYVKEKMKAFIDGIYFIVLTLDIIRTY